MMASPEAPLERVIEALRAPGTPAGYGITGISRSMEQLRKELNYYYTSPTAPESSSQSIGHRVHSLHCALEPLLENDGPYIRAWALAIQAFLHKTWPSSPEVSLGDLAKRLGGALGEPEIRLCSSIEMTVWQYFVGAVTAEEGSETREWFITRLQRMFLPMRVREWKTVTRILERALMPDLRLLVEFKEMWDKAIHVPG
ncbi:hypothetical protein QQX98_003924 [Neonectria punicea]|uniref:Uncharacterized protein n=1 Tax=Neonectria punicea TaxID=979145 RepID=A0ABR1HBX9_9HYPO